ncbi:MAG: 30S ribosome-binding factor RbfA [Planctomycetia bacterium]|nr:30S ribosome-binding factor RbfA [Planctomycetia bacterium]
MKSHRLARVSEVIRETAANTILFELKDPRVKGVTVTRAEVSADLQHAKVFVSIMGTEKEQQLTMHGLKSAAGFIQTKLAGRLTSRYVPHVTFVIDEGVKKSIEVARIIREETERLAADRAKNGEPAEGDEIHESDTDLDSPAEQSDNNTPTTDSRAAGQTPAEGSTDAN